MSAPINHGRGPTSLSDIEILAAVYVTERPEALKLERLADKMRALVVAGVLEGMRPILMYWLDGKQAHIMIDARHDMPSPAMVIQAYRQCESFSSNSPKGRLTWHK